jgi:hypothetical protein
MLDERRHGAVLSSPQAYCQDQHGEQTMGLVEQFSSMCESVLAAVNFVVSPTTSFLSANRSGSTN